MEEITTEVTKQEEQAKKPKLFVLRTTANREDQVTDFIDANAKKKKLGIYSVIRPHGMRGYIFVEAITRIEAEQAAFRIPYAGKILPKEVNCLAWLFSKRLSPSLWSVTPDHSSLFRARCEGVNRLAHRGDSAREWWLLLLFGYIYYLVIY